MPGTAAKAKKAPPPAPPVAGSSATIITVNSGIPTPDPVDVKPGTRIQFNNNDNVTYLIQMLSSTGGAPAIDVVLPALSSVTLVAGPVTKATTKEYEVAAIKLGQAGAHSDSGGGGGRIIINP